jgi:hypothetical protein
VCIFYLGGKPVLRESEASSVFSPEVAGARSHARQSVVTEYLGCPTDSFAPPGIGLGPATLGCPFHALASVATLCVAVPSTLWRAWLRFALLRGRRESHDHISHASRRCAPLDWVKGCASGFWYLVGRALPDVRASGFRLAFSALPRIVGHNPSYDFAHLTKNLNEPSRKSFAKNPQFARTCSEPSLSDRNFPRRFVEFPPQNLPETRKLRWKTGEERVLFFILPRISRKRCLRNRVGST